MGTITRIRRNVHNGGRCSIDVDGQYLVACSIDVALALGLRVGMELTASTEAQLRAEDARLSLRQKAYRYATYKPRTERQVRDHYTAQHWPAEAVDDVIVWLRSFGLVGDDAYASRFIEAAKTTKPMSKRAIRQRLTAKGLPSSTVDGAVAGITPDDDYEAALAVAEKKRRSLASRPSTDVRDAVARFLQYRGFDWSVIRRVLDTVFGATGILAIAILATTAMTAQDCRRERLPDAVNGYQPTTVPVLSHDGSVLYLDRKYHPENVDGLADPDDLWIATRDTNGWSQARRPESWPIVAPDVLFQLSTDGRRALVVGAYGSSASRQRFAVIERDGPDSAFRHVRVLDLPGVDNLGGVFYASMTDDGSTVVLALQRPGGMGDLDLYVTQWCTDRWSDLRSLGRTINTKGFEGAPTIAPDGRTFFFASSGRDDRFGKSDLYVARRLDDSWTSWSPPQNLGPCVNTQEDETSLCLTDDGRRALVVSWDGSVGLSGVYAVDLPTFAHTGPICRLYATAVHATTGTPLPSASITIDVDDRLPCHGRPLMVDADGILQVGLEQRRRYHLRTTAPGFVPMEQTLNIRGLDSTTNLRTSIRLFPANEPLASIYFDRGAAEATDRHRSQLRSMLDSFAMRSIGFTVVGYTDELGSRPLNSTLSAKRAEAIKDLLIAMGCDSGRVLAEGRGIETPRIDFALRENPASRRVDIFPGMAPAMPVPPPTGQSSSPNRRRRRP